MLKLMTWLGAILLLAGGAMVGSSILLQPPPRDSLPELSGQVIATWRYVQRSGTDFRIQIRPADGTERTVWLALDRVTPDVTAAIRGRAVSVRHASNGEVLEMTANGRPVIDYATSANKRFGALTNNRWIGFGVAMAGLTLLSFGLVLRR